MLSGQSLNGVATEWRQRGIHTLSGNFWSPQNLRQMLLSPSIAGYRTHHGNLIEGTWKPIIPREQWELLKALLEDPARSNSRRGHPAGYLLTGSWSVVYAVTGWSSTTIAAAAADVSARTSASIARPTVAVVG